MENKIVKVYVLKGLNGISLVIENYRVSNEKIYGMLTPIYTFEVATDDILQAIGQENPPVNLIEIPKGATNGDMIKAIFSDAVWTNHINSGIHCAIGDFSSLDCSEDWWNAPYKRGSSNGSD